MSVATRNPFALLDEDRPSTPPPPAESAAPAAPAPQQQQTRTRGRGGPASRGGRYYQRGGAAPPAAPTTDDQPAAEPKQRRFDGERKEGRGRGRGRGGDRGGGDRSGRGRPFDRHSQTGKTDSDKKVHNSWGGDDGETERKVEEAAAGDAFAENTNAASGLNDWAGGAVAETPADDWAPSTDVPKDDWAVPPAAEGADKPQSGEKRERRGDREEEEDNTLTLDQYLAQQREKENALVPKLDVRKPNDDADDDVFKGAAPLQKDELEYFAPKAKSAPKARTKKEEKVFIEIEARFDRPNRGGRGGRGGDRGGGERGRSERGRGRGGRGRGGANGYPAPPSSAVNVDDETAFPSLS